MADQVKTGNQDLAARPKRKRIRIGGPGSNATSAADLARMDLEDRYKDQIEMEKLRESLGLRSGGVSVTDMISSKVKADEKKQEEKKAEVKKEAPKIETSYSAEREEALAAIMATLKMFKEITKESRETGDKSKLVHLNSLDERVRKYLSKLDAKAFSDFDKDIFKDIKKAYENYSDQNTFDSFAAFEKKVKYGIDRETIKKINELSTKVVETNSSSAAEELAKLLEGKSDKDKSTYISEIVSDYKKKRTEKKFKAMNVFLNACGREVERFTYIETSYDKRKAARAAFDGSFNIPADKVSDDRDFDKKEFSPYSDAYKKFLGDRKARRGRATEENQPAAYSLSECEGWTLLKQAGVDINEAKLNEAFSILKLPKSLIKNLNCTDLAKVLYDARMIKENAKHDMTEFPPLGASLNFKDVDDRSQTNFRDDFLKKCFSDESIKTSITNDLLKKGVSQKYIDVLVKSILRKDNPTANPEPIDENGEKIKGPIPFITIHHKTPIQDAAKLGDFSKINDFSNLLIVVDMPGESNHELRHITDEPLSINKNQISEDDAELLPAWQGADEIIAERMVDLSDRRVAGVSLVYSSGFNQDSNIMADIMTDNKSDKKNKNLSITIERE
ncbi:MAG: hypothetical protein LBR70_01730 [Lactobacillaceae bacterium]|nr:hypothetical protein [Lactobacillaceae bacterium]